MKESEAANPGCRDRVGPVDAAGRARRGGFFPFAASAPATVVMAMVGLTGPDEGRRLVRACDRAIACTMFRLRGCVPTAGRVVVVAIDEPSLAAVGQWPWPRAVTGELLRRIDAGGPRVIGLDVFFPEPDRCSLQQGIDVLTSVSGAAPELPEGVDDNDAALARALSDTPTVVGYVLLAEGTTPQAPRARSPLPQFTVPAASFVSEVGKPELRIHSADYPLTNLATFAESALSEGFLNTFSAQSGIAHSVPVLLRCRDTLYPSMPFEVAREGLQCSAPDVVITGSGLAGLRLGEAEPIPLDATGCLHLNYRGPAGVFPRVSAPNVLKASVDGETFRNRFVLVGSTATCLGDFLPSPFGGIVPGVEVHATVLDNMLCGDALCYDHAAERGLTLVVMLACGLLIGAAVTFLPRPATAVLGIGLIAAIFAGNYFLLFLRHRVAGSAFPMLAAAVILIVGLAVPRSGRSSTPFGTEGPAQPRG